MRIYIKEAVSMQRKERNNKGFTLVELLVAITVLAIIVVPFLQGFVTAARTNLKAKKLQNATTLATNTMEEVKANSLENLAFQFNYPEKIDSINNTTTSRFDVMNAFTEAYEMVVGESGEFEEVVLYQTDGTMDNVDDVTSSIIYRDYQTQLEEDFEFLGQDSGKYYFVLEGAKVGNQTYDVRITLDGTEYVETYTEGYNEMEVPIIATPDVLTDAFYIQKKIDGLPQDDHYADLLLTRYTSQAKALNVKQLFDGNFNNDEVGRQIVIDVEKAGAVTQVYITYTYTYYAVQSGAVTVLGSETFQEVMYDNAEEQTNDLRSVYLFYNPLYGSKLSKPIDKIVVNNLDNLPINVYIVKQRQATVDSVAMATKEAEYYVELELHDDSRVSVGNNERSCMTVRTNVGSNLYQEGTTLNNQYIIRYSTSASTNPVYNANNKRVLGVTGLNGAEQKDRIYGVTVAIYEEGQAQVKDGVPFIEITGSMNN